MKRIHRGMMPGLVALLLLAGCATDGPVAPLVPLPDSEMPSKQELGFRPWRVVVAETARRPNLVRVIAAELRTQIARYGIQVVSTDEKANQLIANMLKVQSASGEEVNVADHGFEMAHADAVIGVSIDAVNVPRRNAQTSWKDSKTQKMHYVYTSEVVVSGHCTLVSPKTGNATTMQFSNSQTQTSYEKPHQLSEDTLALAAARHAARGGQLIKPIYTRFPLVGYVVDAGDKPAYIRINRGSTHGVQENRKWELLMRERSSNVLMGELVSERVVGTAKTVEVFEDTCIAKCDSMQTRDRAKLGMKVRSADFGFSLTSFLDAL